MIQLIDPPTWAGAVAEAITTTDAPCIPEFTFTSEADTWK
jgi:hypothetical protein